MHPPVSLRKSISKLALLFLVTITLSGFELQAQEHGDSRWVTTWTTSSSTLLESSDEPAAIENQTLRLIVHTSLGGSSLRLRFSNLHGDRPMVIGTASVAIHSEGSSIQSGSSREVLFSGQSAATIPLGAVIVSDPLTFDVPELSNLSISLYLPEASGFLTAHALSNQTNYISESGNHAASTNLPVASETPAWNLLTSIDVFNSNELTAIAAVGDSITDGWGSTASANQRWPNYFARRLFADNSTAKFAVVNAGISGNRVTTEDSPTFGQNLQARFERDVLALSNVSHMVLMEGINDSGMSSREPAGLISAEQVIAGYQQIIARAHIRGIKVIGATLTPFEGAAYYTSEGEVERQAVNSFIRNSGEFDGIIDFEKAVQDPANPSRILPSFTEDNLHPNDTGYKAMAELIDLDLFR
jgi:lysophospholipase L1-like esterase